MSMMATNNRDEWILQELKRRKERAEEDLRLHPEDRKVQEQFHQIQEIISEYVYNSQFKRGLERGDL